MPQRQTHPLPLTMRLRFWEHCSAWGGDRKPKKNNRKLSFPHFYLHFHLLCIFKTHTQPQTREVWRTDVPRKGERKWEEEEQCWEVWLHCVWTLRMEGRSPGCSDCRCWTRLPRWVCVQRICAASEGNTGLCLSLCLLSLERWLAIS